MCGGHRESAVRQRLFDSAGTQPMDPHEVAPCNPSILGRGASLHKFPALQKVLKNLDDFVLQHLARHCPMLAGVVERSDAMLATYEGGARFVKHIDNTNRDGRCLTALLYLNE